MEVSEVGVDAAHSLEPSHWPPIARFTSHDEFEDWIESAEARGRLPKGSFEWPSDSAIAYFHIAEVLERLARSDASPGAVLEQGYCRLIAENGHPDELAQEI